MAAAAAALRLSVLLVLRLSCVTHAGILRRGALSEEQAVQAARLQAVLGVKGSPSDPPVTLRRSAPQFMLDMFDAVSVVDRNPKTQTDILLGNTVRSFVDKGPSGESFHLFNMSSVGKDEKMIKAEFRWFRKKPRVLNGESRAYHHYKVNLFEVSDSPVKPRRGNLITSRLVPLHSHGWEVFNITQIVSNWIQDSQNHGVMLVITQPSGLWRKPLHREVKDATAYLVIVSDDGRRAESGQSFPERAQSAAAAPPTPQHHRSRRSHSSSGSRLHVTPHPCQRVPLYVDFDEIGWSGWIISPRGYHANHCKGSCPFPLGGGLPATNHATVLSIMHTLKLSSSVVEAPCCVPDTLESISLLYFDDEENVVLKQYDEMVAVSCGCR